MSLYQHVGVITPGMDLTRRAALVATARSLNASTEVDVAIRELHAQLRSRSEPIPLRVDARRRVAETVTDLEAKRERVATMRGRLQATDDEIAAVAYRDAIRQLSEAETEHTAAVEALTTARQQARAARDIREQRFRIEDRLENLKRRARKELVSAVLPTVNTELSKLPDCTYTSFDEADSVSAALTLVRVGALKIPVTTACRRFSDRQSAEEWLETPVYWI